MDRVHFVLFVSRAHMRPNEEYVSHVQSVPIDQMKAASSLMRLALGLASVSQSLDLWNGFQKPRQLDVLTALQDRISRRRDKSHVHSVHLEGFRTPQAQGFATNALLENISPSTVRPPVIIAVMERQPPSLGHWVV